MQPAVLVQQPDPFDHPDWLFEVKFDGFRALAYVEAGGCELVSRKGKTYQRFTDLRECIGIDLKVDSAILDGEIVCLDDEGRSQFNDLMFPARAAAAGAEVEATGVGLVELAGL